MFKITKLITTGITAGLTTTELTSVPFQVGESFGGDTFSGAGFTVTAVEAA